MLPFFSQNFFQNKCYIWKKKQIEEESLSVFVFSLLSWIVLKWFNVHYASQ